VPLSYVKFEEKFNEFLIMVEGLITGLEIDWTLITCDKGKVFEIIDMVERKRTYYSFFHSIKISEIREACIYCIGLLKYHPFINTSKNNSDINVQISLMLFLQAVNYTAVQRNQKSTITRETIEYLIYAFKNRDLSEQSMMVIAESLIGYNTPISTSKPIVEEIQSDSIGVVRLIGKETKNLPMWTINYYLQEFCNNYNKIITIIKICSLLQEGVELSNILLTKKSCNVIPLKIDELEDLSDLMVLPIDILDSIFDAFKSGDESFNIREHFYVLSDNPSEFWKHLINEPRPLVLINSVLSKESLFSPIPNIQNISLSPLLDFSSPESIKVLSFSYNSPVELEPRGLIGAIIDLAFAGERNNREKEAFLTEQIGKCKII
jgi:hypothetical protein